MHRLTVSLQLIWAVIVVTMPNDWKTFIEANFSTITEEFKKYTNKQLSDEFYSLDTSRIFYCVVGRRENFNDKT